MFPIYLGLQGGPLPPPAMGGREAKTQGHQETHGSQRSKLSKSNLET